MYSTIENFICEKKGLLNVGYIADSKIISEGLQNDAALIKQFTDMIIQLQQNSLHYNTLILNHSQLSEAISDKRFKGRSDLSYFGQVGNMTLGLNVKETDDLEQIIEDKLNYNYEVLNFKVDLRIKEDLEVNDEINIELGKKLKWIVSSMKKVLAEYEDEVVFIVDINLQLDGNDKKSTSLMQQEELHQDPRPQPSFIKSHTIEKSLNSLCCDFLSNDVPLEKLVFSVNLFDACKLIKPKTSYPKDELPFNALMILSHALPAGLGGVLFQTNPNHKQFLEFLDEMKRMNVITYFPHSFVMSEVSLLEIAKKWGGKDISYIGALNQFEIESEQLEAALNGNLKRQMGELIKGDIEVGNIH